MNEFLLFISKYVSPILLGAILVWRFWGKIEWIFLAVLAAIIGFTFLSLPVFKPVENKLKAEIIAQARMDKKEIEEVMARRGVERGKGGVGSLIYPANMENDYRAYYFTPDLRFTISFKGQEEYDRFFENVDSLMVKGKEITGCAKDTAYLLAPNCYVCKDGFDPKKERFIIKVSRTLNFELPKPKAKPKPNPAPPSSFPPGRVVPTEEQIRQMQRNNALPKIPNDPNDPRPDKKKARDMTIG